MGEVRVLSTMGLVVARAVVCKCVLGSDVLQCLWATRREGGSLAGRLLVKREHFMEKRFIKFSSGSKCYY